MAIGFNIDITGDAETARRLLRLKEIDWEPFFYKAFDGFEEDMESVFQKEGPGWQPLSPAYAEWKNEVAPGQTILKLENRLYFSVARETRDSIRTIQGTRGKFGTRVPYAKFHHWGTRKMPRRRFLVVNRDKLRETFKAFVVELVSKAS